MSALGSIAGPGVGTRSPVELARHLIGYITDDSAVASHVYRETGRRVPVERIAAMRRNAPATGGSLEGWRLPTPAAARDEGISDSYSSGWRKACVESNRAFVARLDAYWRKRVPDWPAA